MLRYFIPEEFQCTCGCGKDVVDELKELLDRTRGLAGIPIFINSGARCIQQNEKVGGSKTSSHTKGLAADIRTKNSNERYKVLDALLSIGFTRIGIADSFIHIDIDTQKPQNVLWTY